MTWNPYKLFRRLVRMGRLSGGDDPRPRPYQSAGIMSPATQKARKVMAVVVKKIWRACDACGYSKVDGEAISRARYQIEVEGGTLYLCGHHFREHSAKILNAGYPVHDIEEKVASK
jgi:hypothetical protein